MNLKKIIKAPVTVNRIVEHRGIKIFVMQYKEMFQYLFAFEGNIYQDHVFLRPKFWSKVRNKFMGKSLFCKEEIDFAEQVVMSGAMRSIEALERQPLKKVPTGK